ncbi:tyrosine-type recombinase/integrase [Shewanella cyperi]|uniref:Tyrosine-type recombinase/integrase n=1 Tax=Shewanella cyperi TaxID=2814292 RepID=A0A975AM53_9GAMM|nr:tyrosine-type recombinase/integrase [Shewanella cyperi]QSX31486.1 tyrosine-type recombinase/integrase [Shewanella cyperi]
MSLSDTQLRAINGKDYSGPAELADRDGLGVRITPNGTITWQWRFRWQGKPSRLSLGRYPDLKVAAARALIPEVRNALAGGTDPRLYWKHRTTKAGQPTIKDICEAFLDVRAPGLKPGTVATYRSAFNAHLFNAFPGRPIEDITLAEWIAFFDGLALQSRVTAGAMLKHIKAICNWAVRRQLISTLDVMMLRVGDVGSPSKVGDRVLTLLECGKIWRELDKSRATNSVLNSVKACMLTGARISELLNSSKQDFDLESMVWTVPSRNSKTNVPIRRPITPALLAILEQQWQLYGSKWTFPAPNEHKKPLGLASVNKLVREIRERMDIPHWRIHDFRRTLSTRLSEAGVLPHVTEKMLGHVLGGVMAVYNKHDWLEEQAQAYKFWADKVLGEVMGNVALL